MTAPPADIREVVASRSSAGLPKDSPHLRHIRIKPHASCYNFTNNAMNSGRRFTPNFW